MRNIQSHEEPHSIENIKTTAALAVAALALTAAGLGVRAAYEVTHVQPDVQQIQDGIVGK